jgi:hypothetical protein
LRLGEARRAGGRIPDDRTRSGSAGGSGRVTTPSPPGSAAASVALRPNSTAARFKAPEAPATPMIPPRAAAAAAAIHAPHASSSTPAEPLNAVPAGDGSNGIATAAAAAESTTKVSPAAAAALSEHRRQRFLGHLADGFMRGVASELVGRARVVAACKLTHFKQNFETRRSRFRFKG